MNETNEKKKVSTKTNVKRITSVLLIFALVITGIFAFLTATDSKVNTFKIGNVDISLQEYDGETPWWETDDTGHTTDELTDDINENGNGIADNMEKLVPGQYVGKEPVITNLGTLDSWTYLVVAVPTAQEADIVQQENSNGNVNIEGLSGEDVSIDMYAYAIQPGYITGNVEETALSVWNKYADYSEGTYGKYETMFGAEATDVSDRIELFKKIVVDDATNEKSEFVIANNTDWKQIGTVYKSADGKNYYVYALNNKLAPEADTPTLFNGFKLIETIGEAITDSLSVWYYTDIPSNDPNSPGVESASDDLSKPAPEIPGKVLIHTENKLIGETLQDNVSIMQEIGGYASDFYVYDTNTGELTNQVAYTGMPITHDLALVQVSKLSANINAPSDLSWLKYGIINQNGELYAALTSCDTSNPAYPTSPIDLFVPNTLTITLTPDGSFVTASCPNATIIANSIDRDSALQKYGTISGTIEVPVKVVAPDSSSLKNVVSGLYLPPNVEKVSWTSTSVLTNVCMPYCKILGDNNGTAGAFYNCTNLTEVQIPSSVEELYPSTFKNCGLTSIVLPKTLKKLDGNVFYGCPLTTVFILSPDSFTCEGGTNFPKTVSYVYYNGSEYNNKIMSNSGTSSHTLVLSENITSIKYATEISNTPELQICYTGSLSELRNIPITSWSYPVGSGTLGDLYDSELVNNNVVLTPNYILSSDEVATING